MMARKGGDLYALRFPDGLRDRVKERADVNGRSMNTEIIAAIEEHLASPSRLEALEARVARLELGLRQ